MSLFCIRINSRNFFLSAAFILFASTSTSQVFYSTDRNYLSAKTEQNNLTSNFNPAYPDTAITFFHDFFPRNFSGNLGLPSPSYLLSYGTGDLGFRFFHEPFRIDRFSVSDAVYYRSKGPFASLTGIAGSKNLQILKLLFTHTYKERLNLTIKFNRYTSTGFYTKQQTYTNNFLFTGNYANKKKSTGFYFYVLNNSNKNSENGGISDTILDDSTMTLNKELLRVRISSASRDNRETQLMFNPWLRLNSAKDSGRIADHFLQLKSRFVNSSYRYKDDNMATDNFYKRVYLDTVATFDSSHVRQFVNELSYVAKGVGGKATLAAGYRNELNQVWQRTDSLFLLHLAFAEFTFNQALAKDSAGTVLQRFTNELRAQAVVSGANAGDQKIENRAVLTLNTQHQYHAFLNLLSERRTPDYIYNNWVSNHFLWFNKGYQPSHQIQAEAGFLAGRFFSGSLFYQNVTNYLYFDEEALPAQFSAAIRNIGLNIRLSKIFFRHLGVLLEHTYQQTSAPDYVRIPQNRSKAGLYYYGNLFKSALQLQIGFQAERYDGFLTYAYMPATQAFYQQSYFRSGDYPFVDFYLNARIRPVNIFLKVENLLQGFTGADYGFMPGYYQPDRAFRFGLNWMFFD